MSDESSPLSFRYQQALAPLAKMADEAERGRVSKRLSELLTLLDFNTTLNQSRALTEILELVLFVAMGETRAAWAAVTLRRKDGTLRPAAARGSLPDAGWGGRSYPSEGADILEKVVGRDDDDLPETTRELMDAMGAHLAVPLLKGGNLIGLLVLGRPASPPQISADARVFTEGERSFVEALAISAAACIDNGRIYEELRDLNQTLSLKVYQLNSLFDVTHELNRALDAASVTEVLMASTMGQLLAKRCALVQPGGSVQSRGVKFAPEELGILRSKLQSVESLEGDIATERLEDDSLRSLLQDRGLEWIVPLRSGSTFHGVLFIGSKATRKPLHEEDIDFLRSLTAQGAASLDNLRLTREWVEKQKMEKELAVAREIQRGLLPDHDPEIPGWDIAGINIPSLAVGGDYYDYLRCPDGRLGLAIADVSGKGTGPALLMSNVQASLRALSGLGELPVDVMLTRLNEQIYQRTEANKYVTVFYGWLDPEKGELA
jgi:sigma-B regulation protein RsbU (phosphoserine phosphatase)